MIRFLVLRHVLSAPGDEEAVGCHQHCCVPLACSGPAAVSPLTGGLSCCCPVRYRPPVPRRMRSDWLHGALSRAEAEQRLRAG